MRIVACPKCERQFDATDRDVGARLHCHCGGVIEVPEQRGHDAAVVTCSACGAPREGEATACGFCGSDFTLRERDLDTICPKCFSRISRREKFCHSCATPILVETSPHRPTTLQCPVCQDSPRLLGRQLGATKTHAAECDRCGGLWVSKRAFKSLRHHIERDTRQAADAFGFTNDAGTLAPQSGPMYRNCVDCGRMMTRRQYARGSKIIVDVCKRHGIWFDCGELERTVRWISDQAGAPSHRSLQERGQERQVREEPLAGVAAPRRLPESLGDVDAGRGDGGGASDPLMILLTSFSNQSDELFGQSRRLLVAAAGAVFVLIVLNAKCDGATVDPDDRARPAAKIPGDRSALGRKTLADPP